MEYRKKANILLKVITVILVLAIAHGIAVIIAYQATYPYSPHWSTVAGIITVIILSIIEIRVLRKKLGSYKQKDGTSKNKKG